MSTLQLALFQLWPKKAKVRLDGFFFKNISFLLKKKKKANQSSLVKREILLLLEPFLGNYGFLRIQE